jgi:deazaflavin-dependent oxidoreductase (nitroreductase family)
VVGQPAKGKTVPGFVARFNPIARRLLGAGVPLGPNALITVRGRKSGVDRTTPIALVDADGRRWVLGTFGDTNWVLNLRAAKTATLTVGKRAEKVRASELSKADAARYYREVLAPYVRRIRFGRFLLTSVLGAREMLDDPDAAAEHHPVFELTPAG